MKLNRPHFNFDKAAYHAQVRYASKSYSISLCKIKLPKSEKIFTSSVFPRKREIFGFPLSGIYSSFSYFREANHTSNMFTIFHINRENFKISCFHNKITSSSKHHRTEIVLSIKLLIPFYFLRFENNRGQSNPDERSLKRTRKSTKNQRTFNSSYEVIIKRIQN